MIEYRVEFSSIGRNSTVYFKIYKYRNGIAMTRIGENIYTAGEADAIVKGILEGENCLTHK